MIRGFFRLRHGTRARLAIGAATIATVGLIGVPSGHAALDVDHGAWTGGDAYSTCHVTTTPNISCKHWADSRYGFTQGTTTPICLESNPQTGQPEGTNCWATLPPAGTSTTVTTTGVGVVGACSTQATTTTVHSVVRVHSAVLTETWDVPVDIQNNQHGTKVSGTLTTFQFTVRVVGHFTHGCGTARAPWVHGIWSGTFDVIA